MTTARVLIGDAHRLLGLVASGNALPEANYQDDLRAFNTMIDSWNIERLSVFSTQDQVFTWPASTISRTLGPSGNFVGNRPVLVDDSTYFRDASTNVSYGVRIINQEQYNGIAVKTVTSTYPQALWINMTMPDIEMTVYPVPLRDLEWHIVSIEELTQPATLATDIAMPPGYDRALRYNLAVELAPNYNKNPSAQVQRIAMTSKRNLKRINAPMDQMSMPDNLVSRSSRYNIFAGNY